MLKPKPEKVEYSHRWHLKATNTDFNMYVRLRDSDENGIITCVTCGTKVHYKKAHAGHFKHGLDFVEDNQHGQCAYCNKFLHGRLDKYTTYMIDRYGRERVEELEYESGQSHQYSIAELKDMREGYRYEIKNIKEIIDES